MIPFFSKADFDELPDEEQINTGKLIFENIAPRNRAYRAKWASNLLITAKSLYDIDCKEITDVIDNVIKIAEDEERHREAHDAFSAVRGVTLQLDDIQRKRPDSRSVLLTLVELAELVAKVTFNSCVRRPSDPLYFDDDSGWWIASCYSHVLDFTDGDTGLLWKGLYSAH